MSAISKGKFSKSLPEELNICIDDYLSGTQAQWRIAAFQRTLFFIKRGRYCRPYSHSFKMHNFLFFLRDEEQEEYSDEDDYFHYSDDEDYDLLV
jgi:hypothetical protein